MDDSRSSAIDGRKNPPGFLEMLNGTICYRNRGTIRSAINYRTLRAISEDRMARKGEARRRDGEAPMA